MASLTWWTWVSVNSRSWWWTGRPGVLRFMGSQRVGHDWVTHLIWWILFARVVEKKERFFFFLRKEMEKVIFCHRCIFSPFEMAFSSLSTFSNVLILLVNTQKNFSKTLSFSTSFRKLFLASPSSWVFSSSLMNYEFHKCNLYTLKIIYALYQKLWLAWYM